ncbi:MAG: hypothetical protein Q9227_008360 [Pyrenula ochraceoflavens]
MPDPVTLASSSAANPSSFVADAPTLFAIGLALSLLPTAQFLTRTILPRTASPTYKYLSIWFLYDALTHFLLEGSFLYHCFFSYKSLPAKTPDFPHPASIGLEVGRGFSGPFLNDATRRYGAWYSDQPLAKLWQEYAKADSRWGTADLTVISLELLTVFLAGPCATYCAYLIQKFHKQPSAMSGRVQARLWFLATMLSTGELYGGFMTFAPEWLSGSTCLDTSDPVFLWGYLVFANMIWVFVPLWVLWVASSEISRAFEGRNLGGKKKL